MAIMPLLIAIKLGDKIKVAVIALPQRRVAFIFYR
jgi:hypothetical protein